MRPLLAFLMAGMILAALDRGWCDSQPSKPKGEATITGDEMEIQDNGARTIFTGHVVLIDRPYVLHADRMVQTKSTGIVDAAGHIVGTWISDAGEKLVGVGDTAQYRPAEKTTELWGHARLTRWETGVDTVPVVVTADRFIAHDNEHEVLAHRNVHASQGTDKWATSDEARLDQAASTIHLWGSHQVFVHWRDAKGISDFHGDKGTLVLRPKKAQLMDHVQGRVVPL